MTGTAMTEASRVRQDLQARRGADPDQPADGPRATSPTWSTAPRTRSSTPSSRTSPSGTQTGQPVLVGTDVGGEVRAAVAAAEAPRHPAHRAERQAARRRGADRRAWPATRARSPWPPTWPAAAPTSCSAARWSSSPTRSCAEKGLDPIEHTDEYEAAWPATVEQIKAQVAAEHDEVKDAGGLYVLGTERHESRRIDNQLRGRSGRQGDPGESRFYLSLEDDLMRLFKSDWVDWVLTTLKVPDDVPIENKRVTGAIASAQAQVGVAELRVPQERPQVRRRDEPAARGHLRRAPRGARGRRPARADPRR